jgi:hypothetical protein
MAEPVVHTGAAAFDQYEGWFRQQAQSCRDLDSPLWGAVLDHLAQDIARGGPTATMLRAGRECRFGDAMPLRVMGLVHRLALAGEAPLLATALPSCGGVANEALAPAAALDLIRERPQDFVMALEQAPQTNEVARAGGLVLGLLWASHHHGYSLRLREVGCSGGLNLNMADFRYEHHGDALGPTDSPVRLVNLWNGSSPFDRDATEGIVGAPGIDVYDAAGCDPSPVDVSTDDGARWLRSFVWPDQLARRERLDGAIELARRTHNRIDRTSNTERWLATELTDRPADLTTVVYHSIVWQYIEKPQRAAIASVIETAGASATNERPLIWLMFEPDLVNRSQVAVTLRSWPGDVHVHLANADFHGRWVKLVG